MTDRLREATYLKEEGSAAWSRGDYDDAIEKFSDSIQIILQYSEDIAPREKKEQLKVLYSNRSAAYLKKNNANQALEDAQKAISIDNEWSKGHIRKGDALYSLARYTDCFNAYNAALRISPNDRSIQEKCEVAQRAIRNESSAQESTWNSNASSGPATLPGSYTGNMSSFLASVIMLAKLFVVVFAIPCLLPNFSISIKNFCYRVMLGSALLGYILVMYTSHGMIKFNTHYLQRIVSDTTSLYVFLVVMQFMSRPYLLAIAPIILSEFVLIAQYGSKILQTRSPSVLKTFHGLVDKAITTVLPSEADSWMRSTGTQRWTLITSKTLYLNAYFEVMQAVFLLIELALPTRNFMYLYLWGQYVRMRYMMDTSGAMKSIFAQFDQRISAFLANSFVPGFARRGYAFIREIIRKQGQPPTTENTSSTGGGGGGIGSMLSKCSIM